MQKPAYRIPSMTEIQNTPLNNYKVVSLFSGVGGSSLGYRMAGFQVVYVNEFIEHAQQMYALNNPGVFIDPRDVREVTAEDIFIENRFRGRRVRRFRWVTPMRSVQYGEP